MISVNNIKVIILTIFLLPHFALASWPSSDVLLQNLAPVVGLDSDEVEAVRFSIKYPQCSSTIVSYTISQDYSLVGFIGTLKTSKSSNIPNLTTLNEVNCKKTNPTQRAYRFIEDQGDALLGKDTASLLKKILSEQIAQGKSEIDSQIASIPYLGTILSNWDCACDAAFETNFPTETLVDQKIGAVIQIFNNIEKGNITTAIDILFNNFGSELACKFLAVHSGVEAIPIVSSVANQACSSVLGSSLSFVIDGADEVAKSLGIKGYDHISPDDYYNAYMAYDIGVNNYLAKADSFYNKCYAYFEPSSMSSDTAKKACVLLRQRYLDQSVAKIEWKEASFAKVNYYQDNIKAKAAKSTFVKEQDFQKEIFNQVNICENYFKGKYPKALTYQYAEKQFCPQAEVENIMWESRKKAQQIYVSTAHAYTQPFCDYRTPNQTAIGCSVEGVPLCRQYLSSNACVKSTKYPNSVDVPCCQIDSSAASKSFIEISEKTASFVKELDGGIYCKADNISNPLQISCSLKEANTQCQNKIGAESLKSCVSTAQYKSGVYKYQCCHYEPEKLDKVQGTQTAKNFIDLKNKQNPGSCSLGGVTEGYSFDPRIVRCSTDTQVAQCKTIFYKSCSFNAQGYATAGCCVKDPFGGWNSTTGTTKESLPPRDSSTAREVLLTSKVASMFGHDFSLVNKIHNEEFRKFNQAKNRESNFFSKVTTLFERTISAVARIVAREPKAEPKRMDSQPETSRDLEMYNTDQEIERNMKVEIGTSTMSDTPVVERAVPNTNTTENRSSNTNGSSSIRYQLDIGRTVPTTSSGTRSDTEVNTRPTTTLQVRDVESSNTEERSNIDVRNISTTTRRNSETDTEIERISPDTSTAAPDPSNQNVRGLSLPVPPIIDEEPVNQTVIPRTR